jgi:hypothetical protein
MIGITHYNNDEIGKINDEANFEVKAYDEDEVDDDLISEKNDKVIFEQNTICEAAKIIDEKFRNE